MRGLVVNHAATVLGAQLFRSSRTKQKIGVIERLNHAHIADDTAVNNLSSFEHRRVKTVTVTDDHRAVRNLHLSDHFRAIGKRNGHRFFEQHVLASHRCERNVFSMKLVRCRDVNQLYVSIRTQSVSTSVRTPGKVLHELTTRHLHRVASRHQIDSSVSLKRRQHQCKGATETDHADANGLVIHRSSTSSPDRARETHGMMCSARSSSLSTLSR